MGKNGSSLRPGRKEREMWLRKRKKKDFGTRGGVRKRLKTAQSDGIEEGGTATNRTDSVAMGQLTA